MFKTGTGLPAGTRALWIMAASGLCGGLAGGLLIASAIASVCKDFRSRENFVRTIIVGGVAGLLLVFFDDNKGWAPVSLPSHLQILPLFLVWQAAVAATIGIGLTRRDR
jgi:glycerol-3-phosphate acyltransferase PlsY